MNENEAPEEKPKRGKAKDVVDLLAGEQENLQAGVKDFLAEETAKLEKKAKEMQVILAEIDKYDTAETALRMKNHIWSLFPQYNAAEFDRVFYSSDIFKKAGK